MRAYEILFNTPEILATRTGYQDYECGVRHLQTADLQTCRLADCTLVDSQTFVMPTNNVTLDNKIVTTSYNLKVLDNEFIVLKSRHGVALPFVCPI